jgi:hypothetical protein
VRTTPCRMHMPFEFTLDGEGDQAQDSEIADKS